MLLSYQECLEKYGTDYKIKKSVQEGQLYVKEKGIYSDKKYVPELEIISKKYPNAIITLNSAFYYYGLTDTIPDFYYVATPKNTRKISDERVKQFYENSEAFDMGKTKMNYDGVDIVIYDKERLLVELIRNKRKFSFDFYKEIITSYRRIVHELDMTLVAEYAYELPKSNTVMRSKTNNVRRATQDLDIDFIKYSLTDESIDVFISKLNCLDGVKISRLGKIEELNQQDYSGKQVFILIEDTEGNQVRSKIDLGVHNRFELEQEEYCFDIACDDEGASLLINSDEQMLAEKLRSLLKFGPFSTRYKDVYDIYYLQGSVNREKLLIALDTYIFNDITMKEKSGNDIVRRLKIAFSDKGYIHRLDTSDKRWFDEEIGVVTEGILEFVSNI